MREREKSTRAGGGLHDAGEFGNQQHVTRPSWNVNELALSLIDRSLLAERSFLAASWFHRVVGNNAACDAGLSGSDFVTEQHSYLFCYVCKCAETDRLPNVDEAAALSVGILPQPIDAFEIETLILTTDYHHQNIGLYANAVGDFARRRAEARRCLRRYVELTGAVPERINVSERGTARADRCRQHKTRRVIRCG